MTPTVWALIALMGVVWWQGASLFGEMLRIVQLLREIGEKLDEANSTATTTHSMLSDLALDVSHIRDPSSERDYDLPA